MAVEVNSIPGIRGDVEQAFLRGFVLYMESLAEESKLARINSIIKVWYPDPFGLLGEKKRKKRGHFCESMRQVMTEKLLSIVPTSIPPYDWN